MPTLHYLCSYLFYGNVHNLTNVFLFIARHYDGYGGEGGYSSPYDSFGGAGGGGAWCPPPELQHTPFLPPDKLPTGYPQPGPCFTGEYIRISYIIGFYLLKVRWWSLASRTGFHSAAYIKRVIYIYTNKNYLKYNVHSPIFHFYNEFLRKKSCKNLCCSRIRWTEGCKDKRCLGSYLKQVTKQYIAKRC